MPSMFISDINIYLLLRYYSLTTSLSYKAISSVPTIWRQSYCFLGAFRCKNVPQFNRFIPWAASKDDVPGDWEGKAADRTFMTRQDLPNNPRILSQIFLTQRHIASRRNKTQYCWNRKFTQPAALTVPRAGDQSAWTRRRFRSCPQHQRQRSHHYYQQPGLRTAQGVVT